MSNITRLSPAEANKLITEEGYTHVDVRTEAEYAAGHGVGAVNVPVSLAAPAGMTPNPDFLRIMSALFAKDAKIVVGCKAGGRSLRAAEMLTGAGFTGVVDQRAGFDGWKPAGLPVENETKGGSYAELKQKAGG